MENKNWKYKIGGRPQGLIPALILLALFGGVSIWLHIQNNGAFIFSMLLTVLTFVLVIYVVYRAIFVKVLIGENGFYYQSRPGNGKQYDYSEIIEAWESAGKTLNGTESYYCNYKTADGQVTKFLFLPSESDGIDYFLLCVNGEESETAREDSYE